MKDGVSVELPAGANVPKLALEAGAGLPKDLSRYTLGVEDHYKLVKVIQLQPEGLELPSPATVSLAVKPVCAPEQVTAMALGQDPLPLATTSNGDVVRIEVRKLGTVVVLCPLPDISLVGTPTDLMRGASEITLSGQCPDWISSESAKIKEIANDPKQFLVEDKSVRLLTKFDLHPVTGQAGLAKADDILARGGGDRVSLSVVFASLLAAKGYSVELASGEMTFGKSRGITQWAAALVDGKPYYIDTADPAHGRLVPLAEASKAFGLQTRRTCAKYPEGASRNPNQWVVDDPNAPEDNKLADGTAALLKRRKQLDGWCNHGTDKAACMERGKVDDELKKQLEGLLAQHKVLETKCKASKDGDACAKRDQIAEQGKAIKAQLDAKP